MSWFTSEFKSGVLQDFKREVTPSSKEPFNVFLSKVSKISAQSASNRLAIDLGAAPDHEREALFYDKWRQASRGVKGGGSGGAEGGAEDEEGGAESEEAVDIDLGVLDTEDDNDLEEYLITGSADQFLGASRHGGSAWSQAATSTPLRSRASQAAASDAVVLGRRALHAEPKNIKGRKSASTLPEIQRMISAAETEATSAPKPSRTAAKKAKRGGANDEAAQNNDRDSDSDSDSDSEEEAEEEEEMPFVKLGGGYSALNLFGGAESEASGSEFGDLSDLESNSESDESPALDLAAYMN